MKSHRYEIEGDTFRIFDGELGIDLKGELEFLDRGEFPSGQIRHRMYRKGKKLHGPSFFYSMEGELLSEAWYFEGIRMGRVYRYYPDGSLYSLEKFSEGLPHLIQEYYYLDGVAKSLIGYVRGVFDGESKLYWPDGKLKRCTLFNQGEKESDIFYDEEGKVLADFAKALS